MRDPAAVPLHPYPAWERDPYMRELASAVVACGEEGGRPWAILADTLLYPEGGGQPSDRGWLDEVPVLHVRRTPRGIVHELAAPVRPGPVRVHLDWDRRFDHMQQHTAQHLLTAVAQDRFGWATTAFHLGERISDVELAVPHLGEAELAALEEAAAAEIRAARPVRRRWVSPAEAEALPLRTRGLPAGHAGAVRLVEIEGLDVATCGGTHLASTAEIEALALVESEPMRGGTRLYFAAGRRVRRLLREHLRLAGQLRRLLGASDAELPAVAQAKLQALQEAERALRRLRRDAADALARSWAARGQAFLHRHLEEDLPFLQQAARTFTHCAPAAVLLLTGSSRAGVVFCLAAGPQAQADPARLTEVFLGVVGGRGGGAGRIFQGTLSSPQHLEAGVRAVQAQLPPAPSASASTPPPAGVVGACENA